MHPTPHPTSLALGHLPLEGKSLACCGQHVFNEDAVAAGGVVYQHMGHRTYQFSVLNNRTSAHPLDNAAGGGKELRVCYLQQQIAVVISVLWIN